MKTSLVLATALAIIPGSALASGAHIRWNACYGEVGAAYNKNFACAVDTGGDQFVISYAPPVSILQGDGTLVTIDLITAAGSLPDWWQLVNPNTCR